MNTENYFEGLRLIHDKNEFEKLCLAVFHHQAKHNVIYSDFINALKINWDAIDTIDAIPFLPVELFKFEKIISGEENFAEVFTSSGTSGENQSKHFIKDIDLYEKVFTEIFKMNYGSPEKYTLLALLPSYLERNGSSLIYMAEKLIRQTKNSYSGFYLDEYEMLFETLKTLKGKKQKTILLGVTYALIDFSERFPIDFPELIVMETGGMKGRRKEMVRAEVHDLLCKNFNVKEIHSEYGMTELLSQAYSHGKGIFKTPPWMKVVIRDPYDPMQTSTKNNSGGINIIDLANIHSCAFLATQDLGKIFEDETFEVQGRFDFSDLRGCNLLIE